MMIKELQARYYKKVAKRLSNNYYSLDGKIYTKKDYIEYLFFSYLRKLREKKIIRTKKIKKELDFNALVNSYNIKFSRPLLVTNNYKVLKSGYRKKHKNTFSSKLVAKCKIDNYQLSNVERQVFYNMGLLNDNKTSYKIWLLKKAKDNYLKNSYLDLVEQTLEKTLLDNLKFLEVNNIAI